MKPIKFEVNHPDYESPVVTCKNWLGREVKFYFDMHNAMWVNSKSFKQVEQGSSLSRKLCAYGSLQMHLTEQQRKGQQ